MGTARTRHGSWLLAGVVLAGGCRAIIIIDDGGGISNEDDATESASDESGTAEDSAIPAPPTSCGDGILDPGEECDHGLLNDDVSLCKSDCTSQRCGDGFVGPDEDCEDGNDAVDDACIDCQAATCGDGFVQAGVEACDDGNADETDACLSSCQSASCGDSHVQVGVEACDDGNLSDEDGCSSGCTVEINYVFVSSDAYPGNLGGLDGADAKCQFLAAQAGLPGSYRAWLSDGIEAPTNRLHQSSEPYVLINGTPVADNWLDLTDGTLDAPINLNEFGVTISGIVWTAVNVAGLPSGGYCVSWTNSTSSYSGNLGHSGNSGTAWTSYSNQYCNYSARLYCFRWLSGV